MLFSACPSLRCPTPYEEECQQKYGSALVWKACCNVFDYLNLAAVRVYPCLISNFPYYPIQQIIDGEVLCVHGGLSPDIRTLDQIRVLSRAQEIPHEGAFCGELGYPAGDIIRDVLNTCVPL
jgi:serine/threonine-protein phosphatase 6 catalytic subunit